MNPAIKITAGIDPKNALWFANLFSVIGLNSPAILSLNEQNQVYNLGSCYSYIEISF